MQQWIAIKSEIVAMVALDRDALHIYAGLGAMVLAALLLRRPLSHPLPWLVVLLLEFANEAVSGLADRKLEDWELRGSLHDLWNLMLAPTALLVLARFWPSLFNRKRTQIVYQAVPLLDRSSRNREIEDAEFVEIEPEPVERA